jgi:hypothetical protein
MHMYLAHLLCKSHICGSMFCCLLHCRFYIYHSYAVPCHYSQRQCTMTRRGNTSSYAATSSTQRMCHRISTTTLQQTYDVCIPLLREQLLLHFFMKALKQKHSDTWWLWCLHVTCAKNSNVLGAQKHKHKHRSWCSCYMKCVLLMFFFYTHHTTMSVHRNA